MTFEELKDSVSPFIELDEGKIAKLERYAELLIEWNQKMNLTAIDEMGEIVEKHFYDCLLPIKCMKKRDISIADLGTGAGFPGMVFAIALPKAKVTLIDATAKKCLFLNEVIKELRLDNVFVINKRAEDLGFRDEFDLVTSRAMSAMSAILEVGVPLTKVGGTFLAMKAAKGEEELKASKNAMKILSLTLDSVQNESLPSDGSVRNNYFFKKQKPTPSKYPRPWAMISAKPL